MRRALMSLFAMLAFAGCGKPLELEGVYVGPPPAGPAAPGVTGAASVQSRWLVFDRAGHVSRTQPRAVADLDVAGAAAKGDVHVASYRARAGRLEIDWKNGPSQHDLEVGADHLLLDGDRWERLDGRGAGLPLTGRYQWTRTVVGIVSEVTELSFSADGTVVVEDRVTRFTPPEEPETRRRRGSYRRDGNLLHLRFEDGKTASVPFFVAATDARGVVGFWQAGMPFTRVP